MKTRTHCRSYKIYFLINEKELFVKINRNFGENDFFTRFENFGINGTFENNCSKYNYHQKNKSYDLDILLKNPKTHYQLYQLYNTNFYMNKKNNYIEHVLKIW